MAQSHIRKPRRIQKRKEPLPPGMRPGKEYLWTMGRKPKPGEIPKTFDVLAGREKLSLKGKKLAIVQNLAKSYGKKYGPDAEKAILNYGTRGAKALSKLRKPEDRKAAARLINNNSLHTLDAILRYGPKAFKLIKEYGNFTGVAIANHGPQAMQLIEVYKKPAGDAIGFYGPQMLKAVSRHGNNAIWALKNAKKKGMTIPQIEEALRKDPDAFVISMIRQ